MNIRKIIQNLREDCDPLEDFEKFLKTNVLFYFGLLNLIDFIQTLSFLRMGIEQNPFAASYPFIWLPFKLAFTFGFPVALYKVDNYLAKKEDENFYDSLKLLVRLIFFAVFLADLYYFSLVLRSTSILGGLW